MKYKLIVEQWVQLQIDRPLNDAVAEAQRHDQALFRLVDVELTIAPDGVGAPDQLVLDADQVLLQMGGEVRDVLLEPLLPAGFVVCVQEVLPRVDPLVSPCDLQLMLITLLTRL